jgi:carboxypeptidase C (cathepsin A)
MDFEFMLQLLFSGGLIVAFYNNYAQIRLQNEIKLTEINENRFSSILIYMDIVLYPDHIDHSSERDNPELDDIDKKNKDEIIRFYKTKIEVYKANAYLYCDKPLIDAIDIFLANPTEDNYLNVAKLMKNNLWHKEKKYFKNKMKNFFKF